MKKNNIILKRIQREAGIIDDIKNKVNNVKDNITNTYDKITNNDNNKMAEQYKQATQNMIGKINAMDIQKYKSQGQTALQELITEIRKAKFNNVEKDKLISTLTEVQQICNETARIGALALSSTDYDSVKSVIQEINKQYTNNNIIRDFLYTALEQLKQKYRDLKPQNNKNVNNEEKQEEDLNKLYAEVYTDVKEIWKASPEQLDEWVGKENNVNKLKRNIQILEEQTNADAPLTKYMLKKLRDLYELSQENYDDTEELERMLQWVENTLQPIQNKSLKTKQEWISNSENEEEVEKALSVLQNCDRKTPKVKAIIQQLRNLKNLSINSETKQKNTQISQAKKEQLTNKVQQIINNEDLNIINASIEKLDRYSHNGFIKSLLDKLKEAQSALTTYETVMNNLDNVIDAPQEELDEWIEKEENIKTLQDNITTLEEVNNPSKKIKTLLNHLYDLYDLSQENDEEVESMLHWINNTLEPLQELSDKEITQWGFKSENQEEIDKALSVLQNCTKKTNEVKEALQQLKDIKKLMPKPKASIIPETIKEVIKDKDINKINKIIQKIKDSKKSSPLITNILQQLEEAKSKAKA